MLCVDPGKRANLMLEFFFNVISGERPYKCALCPKTFATRDTLSKHQHAHSDERNYECGECGKMFKRISHVREHLKSHSQDRPFVCHICEKGFKTSVRIIQHMLLFSGAF